MRIEDLPTNCNADMEAAFRQLAITLTPDDVARILRDRGIAAARLVADRKWRARLRRSWWCAVEYLANVGRALRGDRADWY